jgi:hypothetical protein
MDEILYWVCAELGWAYRADGCDRVDYEQAGQGVCRVGNILHANRELGHAVCFVAEGISSERDTHDEQCAPRTMVPEACPACSPPA